eukprot:404653_1
MLPFNKNYTKNTKKKEKKEKKKAAKILRFVDRDKPKSAKFADLKNGKNSVEPQHISSKTIVQDLDGMLARKNINDFYSRHDTARSNKQFFGDEVSANPVQSEEEKSLYQSEPIAWSRFPMIDYKHRLRKGAYKLHLWTVPIFKKTKGGPKIDPYSTGNWKKFGSPRDCNLTRNNHLNSVILTVDFIVPYKFDVVAPIVNMRRPQYIRRKIRAHKKKYNGSKIINQIIQRD